MFRNLDGLQHSEYKKIPNFREYACANALDDASESKCFYAILATDLLRHRTRMGIG